MIILDDGSKDRTVEKIRPFLNDDRIRFIEQKHHGLVHINECYNWMLKLARGKYINILDSDDILLPHKFRLQTRIFSEHPDIVATYGFAVMFDEDGVLGLNPHFNPSKYSRKQFLKLMLKGTFTPVQSLLVKKSCLEKIGGFQMNGWDWYFDYPTWIKLVDVGEFLFTSSIVALYRIHADSMSHRWYKYSQIELDTLKAFKEWSKQTQKESGFSVWSLKLWLSLFKLEKKLYKMRAKLNGN